MVIRLPLTTVQAIGERSQIIEGRASNSQSRQSGLSAMAESRVDAVVVAFEDQSGALREELVRIDAEVTRLAQAVAAGGEIPALIAAMQDRDRRRSHLRTELAALERQAPARHGPGDVECALDVMREALTDWQGMLRRETGPARRAMQALLKGRLVFTPQEHDAERFYTF